MTDRPLGVVAYFHKNDRDAVERTIDRLGQLGVQRLRSGVSWCDWETSDGPAWFEWVLPKLSEHFEVLPCVLYTPPAKGVMPKTSSPPRNPNDYGDFVDLLLTEYEGVFPYVELWNEPNNYVEWDWSADPEWKTFARMIAAAGERARTHGVKTVLGGMSPFDPNWLNLMYERRAMDNIDVIGIHGFPQSWDAVWEGWKSRAEHARQIARDNDHSPEIWITECGFSTWNRDEYGMLLQLVEASRAPVERVYWYSAEDLDPGYATLDSFHGDERGYHFGLYTRSGEPKLPARIWREQGFAGLHRYAEVDVTKTSGRRGQPGTLITGGAGFVGTNLADRICSQGEPVVLLDNLYRPGVEQNLRWLIEKHGDLVSAHIGDVRDPLAIRRALEGCERVFHLAAQVAVTTSADAPQDDVEINLQGTLNLLEELRRLDSPPPLLFTSTNKIYGALDSLVLDERALRYEPRDEDIAADGISELQPLNFCSPYGCSKGAADQYVLDYWKTYGLHTTVFRMSCIYGPHQFGTEDQGWVAHFLLQALKKETLTIYGDGKQVRDILYVEDLVDAMLLAIGSDDAAGRVFNIGGGSENAVSLTETLSVIEELSGTSPSVDFGPWRTGDQPYYVSDTSSFGGTFGWKPRVTADEGLRRLYEWLRENRMQHPVPAKN